MKLRIWLLSAEGLLAADTGGSSDPYVKISVGDKLSIKTPVIPKTLTPTWTGFEHIFEITGQEDNIRFLVRDKDTLSDDELGICIQPLFELLNNNGAEVRKTLPLTKAHGMSKQAKGTFTFSAQILDPPARLTISSPTGAAETKGEEALSPGATEAAGTGGADAGPPGPNALIITALQGRSLLAMDRGNVSDARVRIELDGMTISSKVIEDTLEPVWNETFIFPASKGESSLSITVEDEDFMSFEFMGRLIFNVNKFNDAGTRAWYPLAGPAGKEDRDRGSVELEIAWKYVPDVANQPKKMDAVGSLDDAVQLTNVVTEEELAAVAEARKEAEETKAKQMDALRNVNMVEGDYQIQVHIIEVRDLKPEDPNGASDPIVIVECMGQKQNTVAKKACNSAVYDHVMFFNFPKLSKEQIEEGLIKVSVFDVDTFSANDLIGLYQFDAVTVYYQPNHEYYQQWVGITDPENAKDKGLQGYLKLSVAVLGPGDKLKVHDAEQEAAEQAKQEAANGLGAMLLMPPSIKQELHFLVVSVYRAEHLPAMDSAKLGVTKAGIDAFVQVNFAGNPPLNTKIVDVRAEGDITAEFLEELWLPVTVPTMTNNIEIVVLDSDTVRDERVGCVHVKFSEVQAGAIRPRWYNVYGAPKDVEFGPNKELMNRMPAAATTYRGRLLLSLREEVAPGAKEQTIGHKKAIARLSNRLIPPSVTYMLRGLIMSGSEMPSFKKNLAAGLGIANRKLGIQVVIGHNELTFERADNESGLISWKAVKEKEIKLPVDPAQVPDVFVYLYRGKDVERVCYARISGAEFLTWGFKRPAYWQRLIEDPAIDALTDDEAPGAVLLRLGIGSREEAAHDLWKSDMDGMDRVERYCVRLHIFQGRHLPAADDNGSLDPYVVVKFAGLKRRTKRRDATQFPSFFETLSFEANLPPLQFAPQVHVAVWDYDKFSGDDFVADCRLSLTPEDPTTALDDRLFFDYPSPERPRPENLPDFEPEMKAHDSAEWMQRKTLPDPTWYRLQRLGEPGEYMGELLMLMQVVRLTDANTALPMIPASIVPKMDPGNWNVEVVALGIRNMAPYQFMPVTNPFVEFDVGEPVTKLPATQCSKKPSGPNANFLERLMIPVQLPMNALFAPTLDLRVKDSRLGGFIKPIVGTCAIPLSTKIPWSPDYRQHKAAAITSHFGEEEIDLSIAPGGSGTQEQVQQEKSRLQAAIEKRKSVRSAMQSPASPSAHPDHIGIEMSDLESVTSSKPGGVEETKGDDVEVQLPPTILGGPELVTHDGSLQVDDDHVAKYMAKRAIYSSELEAVLKTTPWESYQLFRGQVAGRPSFLGHALKSNVRVVGKFKGLIRLVQTPNPPPPPVDLTLFQKPKSYCVRVYVLRGLGLQPKDANGKSDPYIKIKLGKTVIDDCKNALNAVTDADFFRVFEVGTTLPGASQLEIQVWDRDLLSSDDFIGQTVIDLEDRIFDDRWLKFGEPFKTATYYSPRPVERRQLFAPSSGTSQGTLEVWIDILDSNAARTYKPLDIAKPPPQKFEVRLIVWRTSEVPSADDITDQNDLYVKGWLTNAAAQETDTHWRSKKGKGSFNWRMKFEAEWPSKFTYLTLQMWDRDIAKWNDMIAECAMDLSQHLRTAARTKTTVNVFARPPPLEAPDPEPITKKIPGAEEPQPAAGTGVTVVEMPAEGVVESKEAPVTSKPPVVVPRRKSGASAGAGKAAGGSVLPVPGFGNALGAADTADMIASIKDMVGVSDKEVNPADGQWVQMMRTDFGANTNQNYQGMKREAAGKVLISLEILPKEQAEKKPNGLGRGEPNQFPLLPPPTGRLKFSLNPFYLLNELLGPALCRKFMCCLACLVVLAIAIFGAPFLNVIFSLPSPAGIVIVVVGLFLLFAPPVYMWARSRCEREEVEHTPGVNPVVGDDDEDDESKPLV